ncbi:hypothetical protein [Aquimarina sp. AU119]|uniref:hypothetical protein n=1 Tax=Aquimarina sp. AU119 TaxID=2108528 RepID=UPI000D688877|nr:hypothetical protein [Aquimarina sp. AU119]
MKNIHINDSDIGVNRITTLIRKLSFIFKYDGKSVPDHHFYIYTSDLDPVSALMIFKVFEYHVKNKCLKKPTANLASLLPLFAKYRLEKMFDKFINRQQADILYGNLKPFKQDGFFIAPHPISREHFKSKDDLENKYTKFISDYYNEICPDLVQYFKTCICEIASNFLYHALEDKNSILMALGDDKKIEIVCVDNSKGIISSLDPENKNRRQVMKNAFKRGHSSKKNEGHCGTGLWYVQKISECLNGSLMVYSEDISYVCKPNGRVFVGDIPYWKGSIIYLKLFVGDSTKINNFFGNFMKNNDLGLNIV